MKTWQTPSIIKLDIHITKEKTCYCQIGEELVHQFKLARSPYGGHAPHPDCNHEVCSKHPVLQQ